MLSKIFSCSLYGLECHLVEVEVDVASGFPSFHIVGLPDTAINESKERIKSALKNTDIPFPYNKRLVINLAPADLRKTGPLFDLPMAVGILQNVFQSQKDFKDALFVGELALDGSVRHVNGMISIMRFACRLGFRRIFVPASNLNEASLISNIIIYPLHNLNECVSFIRGEKEFSGITTPHFKSNVRTTEYEFDMKDIRGQNRAKRALEIAVSGGHNLILSGPPGTGKTLLARTMPSIFPCMSYEEMLEVTEIYSACGLLADQETLVQERPFRAPHHSASGAALVGGGRIPRPGEITLAHRGVLFLDELPEFPQRVLETLRQSLEDGKICVSRVAGSVTFPARFILVASQNPCPCGYATDEKRECTCTSVQINNYQKKISGPILDRIDMHIEVPRVPFLELSSIEPWENSADIRARVEAARQVQARRFADSRTTCNGEMSSREIREHCALDSASTELLQKAVEKFHLSARVYFRIIKLARTIADMAGSEHIQATHIAEALQYRMKEVAGN